MGKNFAIWSIGRVLAPLLISLLFLVFSMSLFHVATASDPFLVEVPGNPTVTPPKNSYTALPDTSISITYDEVINPATVSTQTFAVYGMQTGQILQSYSVNGGEIRLTSNQDFYPGELVQASATTGTLNMIGEGPVSPTVWQFWVGVNSGSGFFNNSQSLGNTNSISVALGDLDSDGDLDAFIVNSAGQGNEIWINDGLGVFANSLQELGNSDSRAVALGDLDSDGDLDALVANASDQAEEVWINDGSGIFTSSQQFGDLDSRAIALGDLDGDGDLDAFIGNTTGESDTVWFNDGVGNFVDSGQTLSSSDSRGIGLGDLDNDGDLDAFIANDNGQPDAVWWNDGTGFFTDSGQSLGSSSGVAVALGDVNSDGYLDAFVGNFAQAAQVWLNDGTGTFSNSQILDTSNAHAVVLGDVDGDSDLDVLIANFSQPSEVWLNDGGSFGSGQSLDISDSLGIALGDLDHDGDLDTLIANYQQPNKVWLNQNLNTVDGFEPLPNSHIANSTTNLTATFTALISPTSVNAQTFVVHGNFHGNIVGAFLFPTNTIVFDPSPVFAPGEIVETTILTNVLVGGLPLDRPYVAQFQTKVLGGDGIFYDSGQNLGNSSGYAVALGDLDSDNDLDAFVANDLGQPDEVWLNDGDGTFSNSGQSLGNSSSLYVALGDLNGDGDLDAFVANHGQGNTVWFNDGTAHFSDSGQSLGNSNSFGAALGDLDGDGDLDAFVTNDIGGIGPGNEIWLNNGAGFFTDSGQRLESAYSRVVKLGDVDVDGDLDAFVANLSSGNTVWLNDGRAVFIDSNQRLGDLNSYGIALGDIDEDGDLDAFVGNENDQPKTVWLNNGLGIFTDSGQRLGSSRSRSVALGDVDGDSDLDAFVVNHLGQADEVWLNNGLANFTSNGQSLGNSDGSGVALGDLDGDGDLDAFVANTNGQADEVWLNHNLGLNKSVTPIVAEPGEFITYTLTFSNSGANTVIGVTLTDIVPITITDVSYVSSGAQVTPTDGIDFVWQVEALDAGEGGIITITGVVNPDLDMDTLIVNQATIGNTTVQFTTLPVTTTIVIPEPAAVWTFMVYLNGDNNLDPKTDDVFNRLESVANNPNVNIIVLWDRNPTTGGTWDSGTRRYNVKYDTNPYELANYIEEVDTWDDEELNLGDDQTLYWFVSWARTKYPADHYFLSIVDHGGGWSPELPDGLPRRGGWGLGGTGLSWDDTGNGTDPDYLSTYEMGQVLRYLTNEGLDPIDVLFYDACLMGMVEETYEIKGYVDYLIASENIAWATFPYDFYVDSITANTEPVELAEQIVNIYSSPK